MDRRAPLGAAAFAAGTEASLIGELAVYAGSFRAGNMHLINGLHDCQRSRVPVWPSQLPQILPGASVTIGKLLRVGGYFIGDSLDK